MKRYKVIETTDYNTPISEWGTIAEGFTDEALAIEYAEKHYHTQVWTDEESENTPCQCEWCGEGWRVIDYKTLAVQVVGY